MRRLVFLHGSGDDKNAYHGLMSEVAKKFDAKLMSFNAPFEHETKIDGYKWFHKFENEGRRDAEVDDYAYSLNYIKEKLAKLQKRNDEIILLGHSQGGGMAVHVGLEMELKCVISINGDLPYNLTYQKKTQTPIYWFDSGEDNYLDECRKRSYGLIEHINHFHHFMLPESTHTDFGDDLLRFLKLNVIEF